MYFLRFCKPYVRPPKGLWERREAIAKFPTGFSVYYWTLAVTLYSLHHNILLWMSQKKQKGFRSKEDEEEEWWEIHIAKPKDMGQEQHQPVVCYLVSKYFASISSSCIHQNSYYNVDSCISVMVGALGTSFLNKRYCYVLHILGW